MDIRDRDCRIPFYEAHHRDRRLDDHFGILWMFVWDSFTRTTDPCKTVFEHDFEDSVRCAMREFWGQSAGQPRPQV
jgi:hypothetical protein